MRTSKYDNHTPVIFRTWPVSEGGDIIALFPTELGTTDQYTCSSYETIGQHGAADPVGVVQRTKAAKPDEYADLLAELQGVGYDDLRVYQRLQSDFLTERKRKLELIALPKSKPRHARPKTRRFKKNALGASVQGLRR